MKKVLIVMLAGAVLLGAVWVAWQQKKTPASNFIECEGLGGQVMESYPRQCSFEGQTFTEVLGQRPGEVLEPVVLNGFSVDNIIQSPVKLSGKALGSWYFEASFPVNVLDANNKVLGTGVTSALGEWMTTNYVPFQVEVKFDKPTTENGFLEFKKDNPSGLPENDASLRVPVKFK